MRKMYRSYGYLTYDPRNIRTRYKSWWAILRAGPGLALLHRHWLQRKNIDLTLSAWGAHVSVIRGEVPKNKQLWKKYEGEKIWFEYNPEIVRNNYGYWWIDVKSQRLEEIRKELGLPAQPPQSFHYTLGKEIDWSQVDQRKKK